jgi:hypothetical protein
MLAPIGDVDQRFGDKDAGFAPAPFLTALGYLATSRYEPRLPGDNGS